MTVGVLGHMVVKWVPTLLALFISIPRHIQVDSLVIGDAEDE